MAVVVDASVFVAVALDESTAELVRNQLRAWIRAREALHAPYLAQYEWANSMWKAVGRGVIDLAGVLAAWSDFEQIPVQFHAHTSLEQTLRFASALGRRSAYDAAYLALASELGAELWTLDGPLYRNAVASGFDVRLLA